MSNIVILSNEQLLSANMLVYLNHKAIFSMLGCYENQRLFAIQKDIQVYNLRNP